jgi:hypothetical protein
MTKFAIVTRRNFLGTLFFLGAAVLLRRADALVTTDGSHAEHWLSSKLANFFHNKESARAIGLAYLRIVPAEANARQITRLICSSWEQRYDEMAHADAAKIKTILLRQQREDFEKGRIVNVQGWILSQTEARLCALAALV